MYDNGSGNGMVGPQAQPTGAREFFFDNLLIAAEPSGDYDADGDVDGADLLLWQRTLGSNSDLAADGNDNGTVDAADLQIWRNTFGQSAASAVAQAIPEPASCALLILWAVLAASRELTQRSIRMSAVEAATIRPH
jgi:hypothetical protein